VSRAYHLVSGYSRTGRGARVKGDAENPWGGGRLNTGRRGGRFQGDETRKIGISPLAGGGRDRVGLVWTGNGKRHHLKNDHGSF